jgi:hypothetical protein
VDHQTRDERPVASTPQRCRGSTEEEEDTSGQRGSLFSAVENKGQSSAC